MRYRKRTQKYINLLISFSRQVIFINTYLPATIGINSFIENYINYIKINILSLSSIESTVLVVHKATQKKMNLVGTHKLPLKNDQGLSKENK